MAQTYFASIQPGLEEALLQEIRQIGGKRARQIHGGVEFDAARKTLYGAHLKAATATRIWLRVDEFRSRDAIELYNKTGRYPWERLLRGGEKVHIRAYSANSSLYHTGKIAETVTDALRDRFADLDGEKPLQFIDEADDSAQLIMARLQDDRCQLSLDASGPLLHRRGWRTESGQAPLRETIAAAILELIDWQPAQGLVDPMCGSGTIAIEAARKALGIPPGIDRDFAFQRWKNFQPERYESIVEELRAQIRDTTTSTLVAGDGDEKVLQKAKRNADRAGVTEYVRFIHSSAGDLSIGDETGWIVTNPPYGARLNETQALSQLIDLWRSHSERWSLAFLWPSSRRDAVDGYNDKRLRRRTSFENGGLPVDLWVAHCTGLG